MTQSNPKYKTTSYTFEGQEAAVLKLICECYRLGYVPTVRDVCDEFGWQSPNAAQRYLRLLEAKKLIKRRGPGRSYQIMPKALRIY